MEHYIREIVDENASSSGDILDLSNESFNCVVEMEDSEIRNFYKSQHVFITGATGYMGTLLVEKLLRSTDVAKIYVLVRDRRGKDADTRIDELLENVVFQTVKKLRPNIRDIIQVIRGDCSEKNLGMSTEARNSIIDNVSIIFHSAASVKMNNNLKMATKINLFGFIEIMQLARQVKHLKSMIHVSTAYSNCIYPEIDERVYESPCMDLTDIIETKSDREIDRITKSLMKTWPNTYVITKSVIESMVQENRASLPIGIYRPAIVGPTYKEPLEGWISNIYGPTGLLSGVVSGVIRIIAHEPHALADIVPGDRCIAGMIAAAWEVGTIRRNEKVTPVYNYVLWKNNPLTWGEFKNIGTYACWTYPSMKSIWAQCLYSSHNKWLGRIMLHTVPALVIDFLSCLLLRKPKMFKHNMKIHNFLDAIEYFCGRSWRFETKNTTNLWARMNETDKVLFPMSMDDVNWLMYLRSYAKGLRTYIFKDPSNNLEMARRKDKRLRFFHNMVIALAATGGVYLTWFLLLKFVHFITIILSIYNVVSK